MSPTTPAAAEAASFQTMFEATSARVYAYARRHSDPDSAQDVVSQVYLTAWRRRGTLPEDPLPWLLVTARNVLANQWRSASRQRRLAAHLAGIADLAAHSEASPAERAALVQAFERLSADDRETLLLVGWDGLSSAEAAQVLGCSTNAFAARLSRARRRFEALIAPSHADATTTHPSLRLVPIPEGESR